jgi:hypothetical protein
MCRVRQVDNDKAEILLIQCLFVFAVDAMHQSACVPTIHCHADGDGWVGARS